MAKLGFGAEPLSSRVWSILAQRAAEHVDEFNAQGLANTACAFATAGIAAPELFGAIARAAKQSLGEFTAQGLANTAWAFATVGFAAPELFGAIARAAEQRVGDLNAQELASTAWAFATAGIAAPKLFGAIARAAEQRVGDFNAQGLANTAWAFAKSGFPAPDLFGAIARAAEKRVDEFTAQGLANTASAFAKNGFAAPELLGAIARAAKERVCELDGQGLANTAWAFATAGVAAPELFGAIARAAEQRVDEFNAQELANTAWAFGIAGIPAPELWGSASTHCAYGVGTLLTLAEHALEGPLQNELSALHAFACALLTATIMAGTHPSAARLHALLGRARWRADLRHDAVLSSRSHMELSAALLAAGWRHECEVPLEGGLLVIDMACVQARVAVEFDGPSHFLRDVTTGAEVHKGNTQWKTSILEELGWRVHRIGWRQWAALRGADEKRAFAEPLATLCRNSR
jgi:very-short-patch-repair endonuclease